MLSKNKILTELNKKLTESDEIVAKKGWVNIAILEVLIDIRDLLKLTIKK